MATSSTKSPTLTGSAAKTLPGAMRCNPSTRISATTKGSVCAWECDALPPTQVAMTTARTAEPLMLVNQEQARSLIFLRTDFTYIVFTYLWLLGAAAEYLTVGPRRCRWRTSLVKKLRLNRPENSLFESAQAQAYPICPPEDGKRCGRHQELELAIS